MSGWGSAVIVPGRIGDGLGDDGLEAGNILSDGDGDSEGVRCAFSGVVLCQTAAEAVGLNTDDGVGVLVEGSSAMEDFQTDGILLDLVGFSGEQAFAKIGQ